MFDKRFCMGVVISGEDARRVASRLAAMMEVRRAGIKMFMLRHNDALDQRTKSSLDPLVLNDVHAVSMFLNMHHYLDRTEFTPDGTLPVVTLTLGPNDLHMVIANVSLALNKMGVQRYLGVPNGVLNGGSVLEWNLHNKRLFHPSCSLASSPAE